MRTGLLAAVIAGAGLVALAESGKAASCGAGYEPVKIQGNWVCRIKTPKLPIKAKTQRKPAGSDNPFFIPKLVDKATPK